MIENELHNKPAQIFNLDETGMPHDPSPPRVVAGRGTKNPSAPASGDKSQITVLACCSAAGYSLPPFVIFDRLSLKPELTLCAPQKLRIFWSIRGITRTPFFGIRVLNYAYHAI